jgi:AcrR family transcriptional regulator
MSVRSHLTPAQTRQQKSHERVRREILLAAAEVFARRGYAAATLADLAEAAGYAPPSLYRYFESKEEIFSSLIELLKRELFGTFELPVDRDRPLPARLETLLRAQFELMRERRELFAVLLANRPPVGPERSTVQDLRAGLALYEARLAEWLRRHVARHELRCPVELVARTLAGVSHAFHSCHMRGRDDTPVAEQARLVVDLALHGVRAAAPSSPKPPNLQESRTCTPVTPSPPSSPPSRSPRAATRPTRPRSPRSGPPPAPSR